MVDPAALWSAYQDALRRRPLQTKALTAALMSAMADALAQRAGAPKQRWRASRTARFALLGLLWGGPSVHFWQAWLAEKFAGHRPGAALVIKKTLVDQLLYGPVANTVMMSYIALALDGLSLGDTLGRVRQQLVTVQLNGWRFWPLVSVCSYSLVPIEQRALFANCAALVWSTYLSLNARAAATKTTKAAKKGV